MKRLALCLALVLLPLSGCFLSPGQPTSPPPVSTQSDIPAKPLPTAGGTAPATAPPEGAPGPVVWGHTLHEYEVTADDGTVLMTDRYDLPSLENPTQYLPWERINGYYQNVFYQLTEGVDQGEQWIRDEYEVAKASGFAFSSYEYTLSYEVLYQSERAVSIRLNSVSVVEGERHTRFHGQQFDLSTGYELTFADLFSGPGENAQARVLAEVQRLAALEGYDPSPVERNFDARRFLLTNDGLLFYFFPDTLDKDPDVQPAFLVPYEALEDILIKW